MRQKKRVWNNFELFEGDAMAEYLEIMAKKGWMLVSLGNILTFKKIQPADLKFTVVIMNNSSVFDSLKNDKLLGFRELCEDAGWDFVCTNGIMQVFASNNPNIIPIQTDGELKRKLISKNVISKTIPSYLLLLVMCSFQLVFFRDTLVTLYSNLSLITIGSYFYACILSILQLTAILVWYMKGKRDSSGGNVITYPKYKVVKIRSNILKYSLILYISVFLFLIINVITEYNFTIWIFLIYGVGYGVLFIFLKWILKLLREKFNFTRKMNRFLYIISAVLTGVVMVSTMIWGIVGIIGSGYINRMPEQTSGLVPVVTNESLGYESGDIGRHKKEESLIASKETYEERGVFGELSFYMEYEYYTSKFTYALNSVRDRQIDKWEKRGYIPYEKINVSGIMEVELYLQPCAYIEGPPGIYSYEYLIKNKNSLILLHVPEELTDTELIAVVEKME